MAVIVLKLAPIAGIAVRIVAILAGFRIALASCGIKDDPLVILHDVLLAKTLIRAGDYCAWPASAQTRIAPRPVASPAVIAQAS
jgi:hypothetical protein